MHLQKCGAQGHSSYLFDTNEEFLMFSNFVSCSSIPNEFFWNLIIQVKVLFPQALNYDFWFQKTGVKIPNGSKIALVYLKIPLFVWDFPFGDFDLKAFFMWIPKYT